MPQYKCVKTEGKLQPNQPVRAVIAFVATDSCQGLGLRTKMVDYMIEICKDKRIDTIYAVMASDNHHAINIMKKMEFTVEFANGTAKAWLILKEENLAVRRKTERYERTYVK